MGKPNYSKMSDRIRTTLTEPLGIEKRFEVPSNIATSCKGAYDVHLGAICVDMRGSSELYSSGSRTDMVKVAKTFDDTVLRMLRSDNCVDLGLRGNRAYAVYALTDEFSVLDMVAVAAGVHSSMRLLNSLYEEYGLKQIQAGIGVSHSRGLVTRADCKFIGDRGRIWFAEAISEAEAFSKLGYTKVGSVEYNPVVVSPSTWAVVRDYGPVLGTSVTKPFVRGNGCFHGEICQTGMESWIDRNLGSGKE